MIASFFSNLFSGLWTTLMLAFVGAALGVGCAVVGRLFGSLYGFAGAAILGAVVLVGAYGGTAFDNFKTRQKEAEIAQLKFEKAKVDQELRVQTAASAMQDIIAEAQDNQIKLDKEQIDRLNVLIENHKEVNKTDNVCVYPDEIHEIFKK